MKKENYKCRQNTVHIRVLKTTRAKLHELAGKLGITIQDYLQSITQ